MKTRLNLTDIDERRLLLIDATDPGIQLRCQEALKAARAAAWEAFDANNT